MVFDFIGTFCVQDMPGTIMDVERDEYRSQASIQFILDTGVLREENLLKAFREIIHRLIIKHVGSRFLRKHTVCRSFQGAGLDPEGCVIHKDTISRV
jgi:hypothetical protein